MRKRLQVSPSAVQVGLRRESSSTAGSQDEGSNSEVYMKNLRFGIRMLVPVLLCLFAICQMTFAQVTNASLTGAVTDSNGSVLPGVDRKSTRLNSSHANISYA